MSPVCFRSQLDFLELKRKSELDSNQIARPIVLPMTCDILVTWTFLPDFRPKYVTKFITLLITAGHGGFVWEIFLA
jgi:hypothetical protein